MAKGSSCKLCAMDKTPAHHWLLETHPSLNTVGTLNPDEMFNSVRVGDCDGTFATYETFSGWVHNNPVHQCKLELSGVPVYSHHMGMMTSTTKSCIAVALSTLYQLLARQQPPKNARTIHSKHFPDPTARCGAVATEADWGEMQLDFSYFYTSFILFGVVYLLGWCLPDTVFMCKAKLLKHGLKGKGANPKKSKGADLTPREAALLGMLEDVRLQMQQQVDVIQDQIVNADPDHDAQAAMGKEEIGFGPSNLDAYSVMPTVMPHASKRTPDLRPAPAMQEGAGTARWSSSQHKSSAKAQNRETFGFGGGDVTLSDAQTATDLAFASLNVRLRAQTATDLAFASLNARLRGAADDDEEETFGFN